MLIINEAFIKADIDHSALDHLFGIGAIIERSDRVPNKVKPPKAPKMPKRVGFKSLTSMRGGSCGQCGDNGGNSSHGAGGHSSLCDRCWDVYQRSVRYWVANDDYPNAG